MKGLQPLHIESAGVALPPRGAPMALPISIYDRKNRVFSIKMMLKTHFYSKFDGSNEKLL